MCGSGRRWAAAAFASQAHHLVLLGLLSCGKRNIWCFWSCFCVGQMPASAWHMQHLDSLGSASARARLVAVGRRVLSRGKGNIWCFWKCLQPFSCFAAGTLLVFFLDALMDLQSIRRKNNRSIICPLEITSTGERTTAIPSQVFASRAAWHKPSRMSLAPPVA